MLLEYIHNTSERLFANLLSSGLLEILILRVANSR